MTEMIVIVVAASIGAFVKGVTTMGLALIAVPIIALFLDVQTAILSLFLSKMLSDLTMLLESKRGLEWQSSWRLASFALGGAIAIPIATLVLAKAKDQWLYLVLGLTIVIFVVYQMHPRPLTIRREEEKSWGAFFGMAAGATQGLTGAGGPYTAMYLYSLKLTTGEFVFLSSVIYLLFDFSQIGAILYFDLYDRTRLLYALSTVIPVMAGTWLGIHVRGKLDPVTFRRSILLLLALSGGGLMARGLGLR